MGSALRNTLGATTAFTWAGHLEGHPGMSTPPQTLSDTALAGDSRRVPNLPRLLEGIPSHGAMSLAEHLAVHGPLPLIRKPKRGAEHPLIEQIEQAGLRGHGGAGFPTAR